MSPRKNPFGDSSMIDQETLPLDEHIQETGIIDIPSAGTLQTDQTDQTTPAETPSEDLSVKECETLYGAAMEVAHSLIATRKDGVEHRELPEERRKMQGKILHSICIKYDITIPTEFEVLIFGGALIADWQYMTVKESEPEQKQAEPTQDQPEVTE